MFNWLDKEISEPIFYWSSDLFLSSATKKDLWTIRATNWINFFAHPVAPFVLFFVFYGSFA